MAQHSGTATSPRSTSHLASLIDQIELILTSPADFSSTTSQLTLPPLLRRLYDIDYVSEENERLTRIERWCGELGDATRAAYARETITLFLEEVEQWGEWEWSSPTEQVEVRKRRINDINRSLGELPIEWLKSRVQGLSSNGNNTLTSRTTKRWQRDESASLSRHTHYILPITTTLNPVRAPATLHHPFPHFYHLANILLHRPETKIIHLRPNYIPHSRTAAPPGTLHKRCPYFDSRSRNAARPND